MKTKLQPMKVTITNGDVQNRIPFDGTGTMSMPLDLEDAVLKAIKDSQLCCVDITLRILSRTEYLNEGKPHVKYELFNLKEDEAEEIITLFKYILELAMSYSNTLVN